MNFKTFRMSALYFLMITGGIWHITGFFQKIMRQTAGWLMIGLGIWLLAELLLFSKGKEQNHPNRKVQLRYFLLFSTVVIVLTWAVEWLGVSSGKIFGSYQYGQVLQPQIFGVPLAIGFAWLTLLISATTLERVLPLAKETQHYTYRALRVAGLMVVFDLFMEPAAIKLDYWHWAGGSIPLQNFLAWFVISFLLVLISFRLRIWPDKLPAILPHFYWAQLLYFVLVYLA